MSTSTHSTMLALVHHLVRIYHGSPLDGVRLPTSQWSLSVDDWTAFDRSLDFCNMLLLMAEAGKLHLRIVNLPIDDHVRKSLASMKAFEKESPDGTQIFIPIQFDSARRLKLLAPIVKRVVGRGRRYSNSNWVWVAPRAAGSLNRLAEVLEQFDQQRWRDAIRAVSQITDGPKA